MDTSIVREWLYQVERDLLSARNCVHAHEPAADRAAFLIQQAAEKLVKAALIAHQIEVEWTHDIGKLLKRLPRDAPQQKSMLPLKRFTDYATVFRYPSDQNEEPVPSVADIDGWADQVEQIKSDFERWLERRAPERSSSPKGGSTGEDR